MNAHIGVHVQRFHQAQRTFFAACSSTNTNRAANYPMASITTNAVVPYRSPRCRFFATTETDEVSSSFVNSNRSIRNTALRQRKTNLARQSGEMRHPDLQASDGLPVPIPIPLLSTAVPKKNHQKHLSKTSNQQPRQYQRDDCAALFHRTVPTHSLAKVDELLKRVEQAVKDTTLIVTNTPSKKARTAAARANATGKSSTSGSDSKTDLPLSTVLQGMFLSTNPNNSLQTQLLKFILGLDSPDTEQTASSIVDTTQVSTSPTAINDSNQPSNDSATAGQTTHDVSYMEHILLSSRERAILNRMCWSSADACAESIESRQSASARVEKKLRRHHDNKSGNQTTGTGMHQNSMSANEVVLHLTQSLPPKNYKALCNLFEMYVGSKAEPDTSINTEAEPKLLLGDITSRKDRGNDVIVENMVAFESNEASTLLKTTKPFAIRKLSTHIEKLAGRERYHLVSREIAEFFFIDPVYLGPTDARFVSSQERWDDAKDKFIDRIMSIQQAMWFPDIDSTEMAILMDSSDDTDSDLDSSRYRAFTVESSLIAAAAPVLRVKQNVKREQRTHLSFEALPLMQDGRSSALTINGSSPFSRMVFVDNLPIDVQDETIQQVYTRCGDLVSLTIFNRRPDLDPGPLSKADILIRQKKNIKMVGVYGQRWRRPCTPVYGLLTFADDEGSRKAADDSLRIFGTLVERHPVRSIPSSTMTRLYIEGVPDGHPCLDFEYLLGQALDPDLFVCLDVGQNNRAMVGSCEIKFPSFELAYKSFDKLQNLSIFRDEESGCSLNWIRSSKHATLWWTRKLGFD